MFKRTLLNYLLLASVVIYTTQACQKQQESTTSSDAVAISDNTKDGLTQVLQGYYQLKDAMVASDSMKVKMAADSMMVLIEGVDTSNLEESVSTLITSQMDAVRFNVQKIATTSGITAQREFLPALTTNMIELITKFDFNSQPVYKQFCPMAFDDKGAYWLSDSESVLNPYFGDMMLTCGEVKEVY
jgi:Cu(I)/Ag(I) efflux system membrane fusion protein